MTAKFLNCALMGLLLSAFSKPSVVKAQEAYYEPNWSKINQYSPVENFESQGSYGWRVGLGFWQPSSRQQDQNDASLNTERIPRLQINKGTAWPLDFGLSLSHLGFIKSQSDASAWQLGGHLQWTLWEAFQKPSLALRCSRIESLGVENFTRLRTDTIQLGSSYALMRYVSLSVALGQQWESVHHNPTELALLAGSGHEERKNFILSWGARIQLFSPFMALSFEQVRIESDQFVQHAKISLQL